MRLRALKSEREEGADPIEELRAARARANVEIGDVEREHVDAVLH